MRRAILGLWTYLQFFSVLILALPIFAIIRLIYRNDPVFRVPGRAMRAFGRLTSAWSPLWRFSVGGSAPDDIRTRPYVVISNHESTADPFLLSYLPWDMRWVGKEEIYRTPLTGWALRLCGDMRVRRGDRDSVKQLYQDMRATLAHGMPIMIFPEGTRSKDGRLLPFKDGAFAIAIEAGVPILPVAIAGTHHCMPKHSLWFGESDAKVRILEPIPTAGLKPDQVGELRDLARLRIAMAAEQLRKELGLERAPALELPSLGIEMPREPIR